MNKGRHTKVPTPLLFGCSHRAVSQIMQCYCLFWMVPKSMMAQHGESAISMQKDLPLLMVGFSVGLFMSMFSLTPASIGIMEGSMAGAFYWMGLDYESSLLAVLIYRIAYYFVPIAVSIFSFKRFFTAPDLADSGKPRSTGKKPR